MRALEIILKKRDRQELTSEEINFFISGFTTGEIPDYQASALAMAILLNGMTPEETKNLTMAMVKTGDMLSKPKSLKVVVDKHSTGGVGDKTTIVVAPLVAACGLPVGKMSGRGLGFSGGTIDKLESIPGLNVELSTYEFTKQLEDIGLVISGQSADLAPADGKLYALRDVTGTVQSIPLIASSIMSKKIASGVDAIVLDVKVGNGAFMKVIEDARKLAELMVDIAEMAGVRATAVLSDMNQPLGDAVGNSLELIEAIETLRGDGPADFVAHCEEIASHMLVLGNIVDEKDDAVDLARKHRTNGDAFQKFLQMVEYQGGDVTSVKNTIKLPKAPNRELVLADCGGYIKKVHARTVGEGAVILGAGRQKKGDPIDYGVGILSRKRVGQSVEQGEELFTIFGNRKAEIDEVADLLLSAVEIVEEPVNPIPHFYDVIK